MQLKFLRIWFCILDTRIYKLKLAEIIYYLENFLPVTVTLSSRYEFEMNLGTKKITRKPMINQACIESCIHLLGDLVSQVPIVTK